MMLQTAKSCTIYTVGRDNDRYYILYLTTNTLPDIIVDRIVR